MSAEWFAGRLRELRAAASLTQKELAWRIGLTVDGLAKLERGDRKPTWETVVALCGALGVSPDAFLQEPTGAYQPQPGRPRKADTDSQEQAPRARGRLKKDGGGAQPAGQKKRKGKR
jgi:transcriptional regulator with XRE-family HTH domain